jgi:hypothetical protein
MEVSMKPVLISALLLAALSGCAAPGPQPEGVRATQSMTDMDGRPIDPGPGGLSAGGFGIGLGFGSWGRHGGVGVGIGTGW